MDVVYQIIMDYNRYPCLNSALVNIIALTAVCRRIVADTKHTITERSFRPYMTPTGNESLPNSLYYASSGFVRGKILHNATSSQVCNIVLSDLSVLKVEKSV